MKASRTRWQDSILFRTGWILIAVFSLVGTVTVGFRLQSQWMQAQQASTLRLNQLLDTVESTASVACFAGDEVLAAELASGLLKNSEVLAVTILSGDRELIDRHPEVAPETAPEPPLTRIVDSPFAPKTPVGQILLTPNHAVIRDALRQELWTAAAQMALQLLLLALTVAIAMLALIVRPIAAISEGLHRMDATRDERLALPAGHGNSELGLLVADVNLLADRLVQTLNKERALRLRREIDERRYHAIFDNAETGIFILDATGMLTSWNPAFAHLLELPTAATAIPLSLLSFRWQRPEQLMQLLLDCLDDPGRHSAELHYCLLDGSARWLKILLTAIDERSLQGVIHDVTEHKEAEARARQLAVTDRLTGLANRLGLEQRLLELMRMVATDQAVGFALFLVGLDDFKRINETLGAPAGDRMLQEVASRLSACVKVSDTVARLEAAQFALVATHLSRTQDAERIAERALKAMRQHYSIAGSPLKLNASIGIALYPQDAPDNLQTLFSHAGLALLHASAEGGNDLRFFDPLLAAAAERRRRLEHDLRQALKKTQFVLFYQPIVDLQNNCLVGAELLIRWQHPERGLVAPDEFIPLAETTGLIVDIGLWALDAAGRQLAIWQAQGNPLSLSLNVSGCQIPHGLPRQILGETARRLHFSPASLALEITEGILLSDVAGALNWLAGVREDGFSVYLDDFGTGYSSLSYLKRFPVDRLKVDKSFVRDICQDASDRALVEAIVAMARSLEIAVVAEGIEEAQQVRLLRQMGCHYGQGYFFSRPVPLAAFAEICAAIPARLRETLADSPASDDAQT